MATSTVDVVKDTAIETVKEVKEIIERTIHWDHIQPWQQDNHYIHTGYRTASNSYKGSAASLRYLHNETVNIYSHLIGAIGFLLGGTVLLWTLAPRYTQASREDVYVLGCFFLGAVVCLGMSATYHTLSNHSERIAKFGNKLDYLGIVFLIWGSFVPSIYYGFACEPQLVKRYWTMITTIGVTCAVVCVSPRFGTAQLRPFRAAMFVAMGLCAVFPICHGLGIYELKQLDSLIGLRWIVLQGVLYITGAVLYAARIPERLWPGEFDIFGSSHQIFHLLVVAAAISQLVGLVKAFDYRHSMPLHALCEM